MRDELFQDERVRLAHSLWLQAWAAAEAGVRGRHPDWSKAEVTEAVRKLFRNARI